MTSRHQVMVRRDGRFWLVDVPGIGRATRARWASEVEDMAKSLIAAVTEVDEDTVRVDVAWHLSADVEAHLERAHHLRKVAQEANADSARETRRAAWALHEAGLGSTEVGVVLGVSRQRAHQLISGGGSGPAG